MEETLKVINQMTADGVIQKYAVGGAMAVLFYLEPDTTFDLDVFYILNLGAESGLDLLGPIYDYLRKKGFSPDKETIDIAGLPVQFLPVFNPLNEEGVGKCNTILYGETPANVMTPEHLVAIMLQTGRAKDYARIIRFLEAGILETEKLSDIFSRHGLTKNWEDFTRRFVL
jgi:hypothetical protein